MTERRVVVTGMGCVTPLGNDLPTFWSNLVAGKNGIGPITKFDTTDFKAKLAAEVRDFDPKLYMEKPQILHSDLYAQLAMAAAVQAMEDSGLAGTLPGERIGVYVGSGIGGIQTFEAEHAKLLNKGPRRVSAYFIPMMIANIASSMIAIRYGCMGPAMPAVTACASGSNAIGEALRVVRHGYADAMICGGAEATVTPLAAGGCLNMPARPSSPGPHGVVAHVRIEPRAFSRTVDPGGEFGVDVEIFGDFARVVHAVQSGIDLAAVKAAPDAEIEGDGVGRLPRQFLGGESLQTGMGDQRGKRGGEPETVGQREVERFDAELPAGEVGSVEKVAQVGFGTGIHHVHFVDRRPVDDPASFGDVFFHPLVPLRVILLHHRIASRSGEVEQVFRVFVQQGESLVERPFQVGVDGGGVVPLPLGVQMGVGDQVEGFLFREVGRTGIAGGKRRCQAQATQQELRFFHGSSGYV